MDIRKDRILKNNYLEKTSKEIGESLSFPEFTITKKLKDLNLKKGNSLMLKQLVYRNKNVFGRDITKEFASEIASKYYTRGELQIGDASVYRIARINGWLDEICSHMAVKKFSIPQIITKIIFDNILGVECSYNNRKVIKPYELDLYYEKYNLGVEYNDKGWHVKEDVIIRDKEKVEICLFNNINLFVIIENSRKYEQDIKNQIIENLDYINSITNLNITKSDVENVECSNYVDHLSSIDKIKERISLYDNYNEWKSENYSDYSFLQKNKKLFEKFMIQR